MQPMGDQPMKAPNTNTIEKGEVNEQHQNVEEVVVQRNLISLSTTHQEMPRTITQMRVVNVCNDDNHEPV
jgi:hypothetical protein